MLQCRPQLISVSGDMSPDRACQNVPVLSPVTLSGSIELLRLPYTYATARPWNNRILLCLILPLVVIF